jgi:hypothetical protein
MVSATLETGLQGAMDFMLSSWFLSLVLQGEGLTLWR